MYYVAKHRKIQHLYYTPIVGMYDLVPCPIYHKAYYVCRQVLISHVNPHWLNYSKLTVCDRTSTLTA